jgi:hypothetical protein
MVLWLCCPIIGDLVVRLDAPWLNTGAAAGDSFVEIEGLAGGSGNDVIIGNNSDNYLSGNYGNDYLDSLGGNDTLYGGSGSDRFAFSTPFPIIEPLIVAAPSQSVVTKAAFSKSGVVTKTITTKTIATPSLGNKAIQTNTVNNNVDFIAEFEHASDDFWLYQNIFSTIGKTLDSGELCYGNSAKDSNDFILYNSATGELFYDYDGNKAGSSILFARVNPYTVLDIGDFVMA